MSYLFPTHHFMLISGNYRNGASPASSYDGSYVSTASDLDAVANSTDDVTTDDVTAKGTINSDNAAANNQEAYSQMLANNPRVMQHYQQVVQQIMSCIPQESLSAQNEEEKVTLQQAIFQHAFQKSVVQVNIT